MENSAKNLRWVRSENGAIFGVCKGLAEALEVPVGLVRLLLILSIICFGAGLGLYILLAIALPRRDRLEKALQPRILGVCLQMAKRTEIEVGIMRFMGLLMLMAFSIFTLLAYFAFYILLPDDGKSSVSRSNPSVPPSTT